MTESSGEFLARIGTDAGLWASEFIKATGKEDFSGDLTMMRGWFANAIEAGRTAGQATPSPVVFLVWDNRRENHAEAPTLIDVFSAEAAERWITQQDEEEREGFFMDPRTVKFSLDEPEEEDLDEDPQTEEDETTA